MCLSQNNSAQMSQPRFLSPIPTKPTKGIGQVPAVVPNLPHPKSLDHKASRSFSRQGPVQRFLLGTCAKVPDLRYELINVECFTCSFRTRAAVFARQQKRRSSAASQPPAMLGTEPPAMLGTEQLPSGPEQALALVPYCSTPEEPGVPSSQDAMFSGVPSSLDAMFSLNIVFQRSALATRESYLRGAPCGTLSVDKQLGWVGAEPGRGPKRPNLNIQPIKNINGGSHLPAWHQESRFNLI